MRDCSGNQFIGTQGELVMYRIFQKEKQYFKVTAFYVLSLVKYHMKCHAHDSFEIMYVTSGECRIFCQNEWLRMKSSEVYLYFARNTASTGNYRGEAVFCIEFGVCADLRRNGSGGRNLA